MKTALHILVLFWGYTSANGQLINGSFENGLNPDLSAWKWTCQAQSDNSAPAGGGKYCIKVFGGNTQGCFPGYSYQKLPAITNGQSFILSGWAMAQTSREVGIYFGTINKGVITLQSGVTTSSTAWTILTIHSDFALTPGDTAAVFLYGGLTGGPVQGYGYFDLITLQPATGIRSFHQKPFLQIYPNPCKNQTVLKTDHILQNATLTVDNCLGQSVKQIVHISDQTIYLQWDNFPVGIYFLRLTENNKILAAEKLFITGY
jgi:hypothetical protein